MAVHAFGLQKQTTCLIMRRFVAKHSCRSLGDDDRQERLSNRQYWKLMYEEQETKGSFDWFLSKRVLSGLAERTLSGITPGQGIQQKQSTVKQELVNVLDLGCGKSLLPMYLYEWKLFPVSVFCLDYVQEAVDFQLHTLQATSPGHSKSCAYGVCASVCQLPFKSDSFSLITDKGTMDSLLKNFKDGTSQAKEMLCEVGRVLCTGGVFVQVTDEDPDSRLHFLEMNSPKLQRGQWMFSLLTDDENKQQECFVYTFHK